MATVRVRGERVSAPAYLAGIRMAKANPDVIFRASLWSWGPATGAEVMRQYRADLHWRINGRGGLAPLKSRLHPAEWAIIRMPRAILNPSTIRLLNRHARPRFAHRARED